MVKPRNLIGREELRNSLFQDFVLTQKKADIETSNKRFNYVFTYTHCLIRLDPEISR